MKKNKVIKLRIPGIKVLQDIRDEIKKNGKSMECPQWDEIVAPNDYIVPAGCNIKCQICTALFPKAGTTALFSKAGTTGDCPCFCYTPRYLIKRLNQIINYNLALYEGGEPRWKLRINK